ncbi:MAG: hypothetical protein MI861_06795 [Pirellulales bacterium]|nr:hypothetical protein [Pirellulales bacterium]
MKPSSRIALFLGLVLCVAGAHLAFAVFEPEWGRDLALQQFEASDTARQQMRSYEHLKRLVLTSLDFSLPLAAVALFYGDVIRWLQPKEEK